MQQDDEDSEGAPDLSVIVCSLGLAQLSRALASVADSVEMSGAVVELVVVWQGEVRAPDVPPGTRIVDVFPVGVSHARNRGLAVARAPIVAFVDDDEVVDRGWVAGVVAAFARQPRPAAAFGPVSPLDDDGFPYCQLEGDEPRRFDGPSTPPWIVGTGGNMSFDRDLLVEAGGFDLAFGAGAPNRSGEDAEIITHLLRRGGELAWEPAMRVYHPTKTEAECLAARQPYGFGMGRVARFHRDPGLAARYVVAGLQSFAKGMRTGDPQRRREARSTLRSFAVGVLMPARPHVPLRHLQRVPAAIGDQVIGESVEPVAAHTQPAPHFVYGIGAETILHLHVSPTPMLERGYAEREAMRREGLVDGIPCSRAVATDRDALWVLEDRLEGCRPRPRDAARWLPRVLDWAAAMAGASGPRLEHTAGWSDEYAALLAAVQPALARRLAVALDIVAGLPAVRVHGALARQNVLISSHGVGAVGWTRARLHGAPGLDLVTLVATSTGDVPEPGPVSDLLQERGPAAEPIRCHLRRLGADNSVLAPLVLVALASLVRAEAAEATPWTGGRPARQPWARVLANLAPVL